MNALQAHTELHSLAVGVPGKLLRFARAMATADHGPAVDGWGYFLEKPWKWQREYIAWHEAGEPQDGDAGWSQFTDALEAMLNV